MNGAHETWPAERDAIGYSDPPPFEIAVQGQKLAFYPGGSERLEALLELIGSARQSLRLCFYIFAEDDCGRRVRDALVAAARRGVEVTVILDEFGARAGKIFFQPMIEAGGAFSCFSTRWSQRYLIRNHQKIVIADRRRAMIGGFNVADSYFAPPEENGWNDLGVTIEGSAVDELSRWFDRIVRWSEDPGANWRALRRMVRAWNPGSGPVQLLIGGPCRGLSSWARSALRDLQTGSRLDMMMAYFSPSNRMMRCIGKIACTGEARLIVAGKSDNMATIGATRSLYDYLLKRRARVWEFDACKLHTKLIVIDDAVYFGSANLDMRSLYLNLEVMLRIEDSALAERMRTFIRAHEPASTRITPGLHKSRATLLNRIRWNLAWFLVAVVDYTVSRRLNLGL